MVPWFCAGKVKVVGATVSCNVAEPVPLKLITVGELVALLVTVMVAERAPTTEGVKVR